MTGKRFSRLRILPGLLAGCVFLTQTAFAQDPVGATGNAAAASPDPADLMTTAALLALSAAADDALALGRGKPVAADDATVAQAASGAPNDAAVRLDMADPTDNAVPPTEAPVPPAQMPVAPARMPVPVAQIPVAPARMPVTVAQIPAAPPEILLPLAQMPVAPAVIALTLAELPLVPAKIPVKLAQMPVAPPLVPFAEMPAAPAVIPLTLAQISAAPAQMPVVHAGTQGPVEKAAPNCVSSCDAMGSRPERKSIFAANQVSDGDLGVMRAGFFTAAGAQFDFGASVSTLINGELALQSTLNWTPTGLAVQQMSGSTAVASMAPDPLGQQATTVSAGQTQVFSNLTNGNLQNFVINAANGQTIAQSTNIQLTIYNMADWQRQLAQNSVAAQLAADTMTAAGLAAH